MTSSSRKHFSVSCHSFGRSRVRVWSKAPVSTPAPASSQHTRTGAPVNQARVREGTYSNRVPGCSSTSSLSGQMRLTKLSRAHRRLGARKRPDDVTSTATTSSTHGQVRIHSAHSD